MARENTLKPTTSKNSGRRRIDLDEGFKEDLIDIISDPEKAGLSVRQIARLMGEQPQTIWRAIQYLMMDHQQEVSDLREAKDDVFLKFLEDRMLMAMKFITPEKFATATLQQVATTFGILFDKRAILMNRPTSIVGHQELRKLEDAIPLILKEAARRGQTIDASYSIIDHQPAVPDDDVLPMDS